MKKVMVVDDSPFVYETMKAYLEGSEFLVAGYAKSGEESLALYEEIVPDIVTMDVILPGMDGMEAAESILGQWPDAKIVLVSSLAYDDTIEKAEHIGARGFVAKPFEKEEILDAFHKCLEE